MVTGAMGWRRAVAAVVALACLGLAGCSDEKDPDEYDSGLPSDDEVSATTEPTTPSPTPTEEAPPTLSANANNTSPAAAKAFAHHVVTLLNYSQRTLDGTPFRAVVAPSCEVCMGALETLEDTLAKGAVRVEGGHLTTLSLRYLGQGRRRDPLIDIVVKATTERVFYRGKPKPVVTDGATVNFVWYLEFTKARGWQLVDWEGVD